MSRLKRWNAGAVLVCAMAAPLCQAQFWVTDSAAATVVSVTGSVSVLRDNQPQVLSVGENVQVKQVILSGPNGHALFKVSDGSTFEVFPDSRVIFRQDAPNWRNLINVIFGRVRVQIEHFGAQPNPNRVYTPTAVISVRGTIFDVEVNDDDESTRVEVEEGSVEVWHNLIGGSSRTLKAGEWLTVYKTEPLAVRLIDKSTVIQHVMRAAWDFLNSGLYRTGRPGGSGPLGTGPGTGTGVGEQQAPPPPSGPPPPTAPPGH